MIQIKPVPYYTLCDKAEFKALAAALRTTFVPLVARRFEMHHLTGFAHGAIIRYVAQWKKEYPYYLRTDIAKYYPGVSPVNLITQAQIAYRDLLGLRFVPRRFKEQFMPGMVRWMRSLPLEIGLPLGSAMSSILAPVALIPLWLTVKRQHKVKLIVYMDDTLILCKDEYESREMWQLITNQLHSDLNVGLNHDKTRSGRFAGDDINFCGWSFSGGYVRASEEKCRIFKEGIGEVIMKKKTCDTRSFIKLVNHKIDGFGHYYKYGNVLRQFHRLDCHIRMLVRGWLTRGTAGKACTNAELEKLGLHSLVNCYYKAHGNKTKTRLQQLPPSESYYALKPPKTDYGAVNSIAQNTENISKQLLQVIAQQRKLLNVLTNLQLDL